MAYAASNLQSNKNQLMVISLAMFGAIIAAIVVSTLLVMTLVRGEFANALNDVTTNAPTTQNVSAPSDFCTGTSTPQNADGSSASGSSAVSSKHWSHRGSVVNSYNNTSTSTVTNNVSESTTNTTNTSTNVVNTITGSFNLGSYNQVDSNNTVNSNNTIETNVNPDNSVNVNSNNTTTNNVDSHDVDVDIEDSILVAL
jgi:hypothetical protein